MKYLPQSPAASGIVFYSSPSHQNFNDVMGRLDHNFSDKDHASVRYDWQLFTNRPVYTASNILSYADGSNIIAQNALTQWTHVFNPVAVERISRRPAARRLTARSGHQRSERPLLRREHSLSATGQ